MGDGKDKEVLKIQANNLKNVFFLGYQDPTPFYEKASILCMTSLFEGFPMVLTEAMQHGCIPIAYDSFPALKDILSSGIDGFAIKSFDKKEFATQLLELINNQELRERLAGNAIRNVARFDSEIVATQWFDLFARLLKQHEG